MPEYKHQQPHKNIKLVQIGLHTYIKTFGLKKEKIKITFLNNIIQYCIEKTKRIKLTTKTPLKSFSP